MLLDCRKGYTWCVLFDLKGLWQILDGQHRLTARHISHARCRYTVAGRDEEMLTFCIGSTAAAWHLPLLLFAALLCWQGGWGGGRLALATPLFLAGMCLRADGS